MPHRSGHGVLDARHPRSPPPRLVDRKSDPSGRDKAGSDHCGDPPNTPRARHRALFEHAQIGLEALPGLFYLLVDLRRRSAHSLFSFMLSSVFVGSRQRSLDLAKRIRAPASSTYATAHTIAACQCQGTTSITSSGSATSTARIARMPAAPMQAAAIALVIASSLSSWRASMISRS